MLTHYAAATKLSKASLCCWRDLIDSGEVEIDRRARLNLSAYPKISTSASTHPSAFWLRTNVSMPQHAMGRPHDDRFRCQSRRPIKELQNADLQFGPLSD
jgi:hypothetical protein